MQLELEGDAHPYRGIHVTLLTKHEKERAIAPSLETALQITLSTLDSFDTDTLGTFTREIPRAGTQREAARKKAELACRLGGARFGLGSEGAFTPFGLGTVHVELLVFVDAMTGLEVVGRAHGPGNHAHALLHTREQLSKFAQDAEFPAHALVVRPEGPDHSAVRRGLSSWHELEAAFRAAQADAANGAVFVEHDLRASMHPSRMKRIAAAAQDLANRLLARCPECSSPGFGRERAVPGLACEDCGAPTPVAVADEVQCPACGFVAQRLRAREGKAPASQCEFCNP